MAHRHRVIFQQYQLQAGYARRWLDAESAISHYCCWRCSRILYNIFASAEAAADNAHTNHVAATPQLHTWGRARKTEGWDSRGGGKVGLLEERGGVEGPSSSSNTIPHTKRERRHATGWHQVTFFLHIHHWTTITHLSFIYWYHFHYHCISIEHIWHTFIFSLP